MKFSCSLWFVLSRFLRKLQSNICKILVYFLNGPTMSSCCLKDTFNWLLTNKKEDIEFWDKKASCTYITTWNHSNSVACQWNIKDILYCWAKKWSVSNNMRICKIIMLSPDLTPNADVSRVMRLLPLSCSRASYCIVFWICEMANYSFCNSVYHSIDQMKQVAILSGTYVKYFHSRRFLLNDNAHTRLGINKQQSKVG